MTEPVTTAPASPPAQSTPSARAWLAWLRSPVRVWSAYAIDAAVASYAIWSVACHAVMLGGGSTYTLAAVAGVAILAGAVAGGFYARSRVRRRANAAEAPAPPAAEAQAQAAPRRNEQLALGAMAIVVIALWLVWRDPVIEWVAIVVYLLVAFVLCAREELPAQVEPTHVPRWQETALWAIAVASGFLAIYVHRWRNDDCYYINLAVTLVDLPHAPLLSMQTIHAPLANMPDSNVVFTPYRVHTFEALGGMLSFVTGIEAIRVIHVGIAAVASSLIPLALARLFRMLDAERWFYMLVAVMLFYVVDGSGDRGFANQAIVRAFTGKSVMLSVAVPMLVYSGMALGSHPSPKRLGLFTAAQISAVGLSSTGLWLAPVTGMLAVAVPLVRRVKSIRAVAIGLLGSAYVVGLGLWVRAHMMGADAEGSGKAATALAVHASAMRARYSLLSSAFEQNLGPPTVAQFYLGLLLLAIPLSRTSLARRYVAVFCLALTVLLMNPYFAQFLRFNIYGKFTGQRAFWVAPLPAAVGLCFAGAIPATAAGIKRRAPWIVAMCIALFIVFATLPTRYVLSRRNNVVFHWPPGPKVPESAFAVVRRLTSLMPAKSIVLAPEMVSWYLPTVQGHPYPLLANKKYLHASDKEERHREDLVRRVSRYDKRFSDKDKQKFLKDLAGYDVGAIVLSRSAVRTEGLRSAIKSAGYRKVASGVSDFEIWSQRTAPPSKRRSRAPAAAL